MLVLFATARKHDRFIGMRYVILFLTASRILLKNLSDFRISPETIDIGNVETFPE